MRAPGKRTIVLSLLALVLIIGGTAIYQKIEWTEEEFKLQPKAIAFRQQYLAASRLLEDSGYTVTNANYQTIVKVLPHSEHDVLWISELDSHMPQQQLDALLKWVEYGGHLLSSVRYEYHNPDYEDAPLLYKKMAEFDIEIGSTQDAEDEYDPDQIFEDADLSELSGQINYGPDIVVELQTNSYFTTGNPTASTIGHADINDAMISQNVGQGRISLLNSRFTFNNKHIGNVDNAYLLLALLQLGHVEKIAVIENTRHTPGLLSTLWAKFPLVIGSFLTVLAAWLLYAARRLGPVEYEHDQGRSNLLAHLAAKAQFWRKHKKLDTLLKPLRAEAIAKIRPLNTHAASADSDVSLSEAELNYATKLGQCSIEDIRTALFLENLSDTDLTTSVSVLRNILNHSTIGPNRL